MLIGRRGNCFDEAFSTPHDFLLLSRWFCWHTRVASRLFSYRNAASPSKQLLRGLDLSTESLSNIISNKFTQDKQNRTKWKENKSVPGLLSLCSLPYRVTHATKSFNWKIKYHDQVTKWKGGSDVCRRACSAVDLCGEVNELVNYTNASGTTTKVSSFTILGGRRREILVFEKSFLFIIVRHEMAGWALSGRRVESW